jgi:hypothetical protein
MSKSKNGNITNSEGFEALMYQLLETELGGKEVYTLAIECAINPELKEEWQKYLSETKEHIQIARTLLEELGMDPDAEVPARLPVRTIGKGLIAAMQAAKNGGSPAEAELTAAECVVEAETKDHMNWTLLGALAEQTTGDIKQTLKDAVEKVEHQEDHHYYHTKGWVRELWMQALGLPAALPPPEEIKKVETAIGASRAEQQREKFVQ